MKTVSTGSLYCVRRDTKTVCTQPPPACSKERLPLEGRRSGGSKGFSLWPVNGFTRCPAAIPRAFLGHSPTLESEGFSAMAGVPEKPSSAGPERGSSCRSPNIDQENGDPSVLRYGQNSVRGHLFPCRAMLAEMVGTFILVFSACGVISCSYVSRGELGLTEYALTGGGSLVLLSIVVGPISGAHVNPSITLAFAAVGRFPWSKVPHYVAAQMFGSTAAAYVGKLVYKTPPEFAATRPANGAMTAFWAELFATMFIMLISSALSFHAEAIGQAASFAIGAAIGLAVLITGPVSGGSMNPARSLGPAIVVWKFDHLWLYFLGPTVGALAGALLYKLMQLPLARFPQGHCNSSSSSSSSSSSLPPPAALGAPGATRAS